MKFLKISAIMVAATLTMCLNAMAPINDDKFRDLFSKAEEAAKKGDVWFTRFSPPGKEFEVLYNANAKLNKISANADTSIKDIVKAHYDRLRLAFFILQKVPLRTFETDMLEIMIFSDANFIESHQQDLKDQIQDPSVFIITVDALDALAYINKLKIERTLKK